jgi:hypothetical protein
MQPFAIEHIEPRSREGETTLENLAFCCQGCNNHKYTKTYGKDPASGILVPLFHPRKQRWDEHFAWNDNATLVIGASPTGRATVEILRLNREGLVNLRRLLFSAGEHPPKEPAEDSESS